MYTLKKGKIKKERQEGGKGEEEKEGPKGPKKKNQYNQVQDPIDVHGIDNVNMSHRYEHEECRFFGGVRKVHTQAVGTRTMLTGRLPHTCGRGASFRLGWRQ